ncbi:hypothetical protein Bbelb_376400 [Branchiostoma belcheri]|nr:hypothetical protein Bbelb_376400 [Branchiostoma belcheri]
MEALLRGFRQAPRFEPFERIKMENLTRKAESRTAREKVMGDPTCQRSKDKFRWSKEKLLRSEDKYYRPQDRYHSSEDNSHRSEDKCNRSEAKYHMSKDKCHRSEDKCHRSEDKCHRSEDRCHRSEDRCHRSEDKCHRSEDSITTSTYQTSDADMDSEDSDLEFEKIGGESWQPAGSILGLSDTSSMDLHFHFLTFTHLINTNLDVFPPVTQTSRTESAASIIDISRVGWIEFHLSPATLSDMSVPVCSSCWKFLSPVVKSLQAVSALGFS